ncbi:MAG: 16S rRNA (adenine(1518)-N(6)/adenine(1519)-N(6))-dimethyltransferase RsmA [Planctomycetes bacterium]|nr:16S rRNA (adenine(1518)-N(6)/adenine(1519)-N(6))-dimethyltransferase RsmA [Planctomycetota bacterium]
MSSDELRRPLWSAIERELLGGGFHPSRRLGQNFLREPRAVAAVVAAAELDPGARVVEIGPGYGVLSWELAARGAELIAVEIDPRLAEIVEELLAPFPNARVLRGDALAGKHELAPLWTDAIASWSAWSLVANLPYSIASPVIALVARLPVPPRRIVVTVQLEVAERLLAPPGGGDYGPLSVRVELAYRGVLVRKLSPGSFSPQPDVDSAIVRLDLRDDRPTGDDWPALDRLVDTLFQQRRKAVGGVLRKAVGSAETTTELLAAHGIEPDLRPERLAPEALLRLARDPRWKAVAGGE